jgi:hypothetical protein
LKLYFRNDTNFWFFQKRSFTRAHLEIGSLKK